MENTWQQELHKLAKEKKWSEDEMSKLYLIIALVQADIKEKILEKINEV